MVGDGTPYRTRYRTVRHFREINRKMNDTGIPQIRHACVYLWAHDASLSRRLAWRFECQGIRVENQRIDGPWPVADDPFVGQAAHVVDLGWDEAQIEAGMAVVFRLTDSEPGAFLPVPVYVLAPWFDAGSRPAWAELGVRLVLDRTTPPPQVADLVVADVASG